MNLPESRVLLLGAGAACGGRKEAGYSPSPPADADFFGVAGQLAGHGTPGIARRVLKSVWELYGRTPGVSLEGYYQDIEARAAILAERQAMKARTLVARRLYYHRVTLAAPGTGSRAG